MFRVSEWPEALNPEGVIFQFSADMSITLHARRN